MDDLAFGSRNKRGDWTPHETVKLPPLCAWPPRPVELLKWLPSYLFPWNAFHMATALAYWSWVVPDVETMTSLSWGWALWLYAVNAAAIFIMYGSIELFFYVRRKQGTQFKFNGRFPADHPSDVFWFKSQNIDNVLRTFLVGIPCWTSVEVLLLWCFANGYVPWLSWADHPVYLAALVLVAPIIHEVHFFCIHRLIHVPILYKWVHSVHHTRSTPRRGRRSRCIQSSLCSITRSRSGTSSSRRTRSSACSSCISPASARSTATSASTGSRSPRASRSIAMPTRTTCITSISR